MRPMRLLMIDSAPNAILIARALRQGGRSVDCERVEDASSMRAALAKGEFDLIISDWSLAGFSALGALDILKERGLDIPFIILSDSIGEHMAAQAKRAGAHDLLAKSDLELLGPAVEHQLHASRNREAQRRAEEGSLMRGSIIEGWRDTSLSGQLRRTFMLIGTLVSFAFVASALSFFISYVWLMPEVIQCRQAQQAASDLTSGLLDEETGLRGYLLTHDTHFLEPYRRGVVACARANSELDVSAAPITSFAASLVHTRAAAERWQERWAKPIAEMSADIPPPSMQEGKALFDAYRDEQTTLARVIAERTELLSRHEQQTAYVRVVLVLTILLSLLILSFRQYHALRGSIVGPLAALLRYIGRVRDGELLTRLEPSGPSELRLLAAGLGDMVRALAVAREVAESRDELVREHSNLLRQILDASREFSESLNLEYVVRSVRSSTKALGGYDEVVVWVMSDDQKGLRDADGADSSVTTEEHIDNTVAWRAAKSGRIMFEGPDGRARFGDTGVRLVRIIAIPLIVGARVVGALEARYAEAQVASGEAVEILEMLAAHAATAIESARLNQIAEERSQVDPLTKLSNRRRLEEDLDAECKRCARYGRPLAFVMLDVDHFKSFNDSHGHPQGDLALQEVAEVIGSAVRTTDSAYRYGGEEFCVLLRETGADSAMAFAERLRHRIELRFAGGTTPGITASFGVAEFSPQTQTPRSLVESADAAMYESKRAGRNCVVLSMPPAMSSAVLDSAGKIAIEAPLPARFPLR